MNISGFKQQRGHVFGDRRELNFGGSIVKGCRSGMIDLVGQLRLFPTEDMKELLNSRQTYCSSNLSLGTGGNLAPLKMS